MYFLLNESRHKCKRNRFTWIYGVKNVSPCDSVLIQVVVCCRTVTQYAALHACIYCTDAHS